jgi:hypothetical protein
VVTVIGTWVVLFGTVTVIEFAEPEVTVAFTAPRTPHCLMEQD